MTNGPESSKGHPEQLEKTEPAPDQFKGKDRREDISGQMNMPAKDIFIGKDQRVGPDIQMARAAPDKFKGEDKREKMPGQMKKPKKEHFIGKDRREKIPSIKHRVDSNLWSNVPTFTQAKIEQLLTSQMNTEKKSVLLAKQVEKKAEDNGNATIIEKTRDQDNVSYNDAENSKETSPTDLLNQEAGNEDNGKKSSDKSTLTESPTTSKNRGYWLAQDVRKITEIKVDKNFHRLYLFDKVNGYFYPHDIHSLWGWMIENVSDIAEKLNSSLAREVYHQLLAVPSAQTTMEEFDPNQKFVNCQNCVVDVLTGKTQKHAPKYLFVNRLPGRYLGQESPKPENYLNWLFNMVQGDKDVFKLLLSVVGYLISNFHNAKKFFWFFGTPDSGKSELLHMIELLVGEALCSHISLDQMSEKHTACEFYGKKLNTCAELEPGKAIKNTKVLKALSGGDWIDANPKGVKHFSFRGKTKVIQASNPDPLIAPVANEEALRERLIPVEIIQSIPKEKRIDKFAEKLLAAEADEIITFHVNQMRQSVVNGKFHFDLPFTTQLLLARLRKNNDSVRLFVEVECILDSMGVVFKDELIMRYMRFCEEHSLIPLSENQFGKVLCCEYPQIDAKHRARKGDGGEGQPIIRGIRFRDEG